jgi:hypothetical protein
MRGRSLVVIGLVVLAIATACSSTPAKAKDNAGPTAKLTLSTTPKASMWNDGTANCPVTGKPAAQVSGTTPAPEGIAGVLAFPAQSRTHVDGCVAYPVSPPIGGDHNPVWSTCGFYTSAVPNEHAVHDLEHGAVWIAFGVKVGAPALNTIRAEVAKSPFILASPYPGLGSTVVLTAWTRQLTLTSVTDPRFDKFITTYLQGPQTPELGAPCEGGMGTPG